MGKVLNIAVLAISAFVVISILTFAGPCVHDDGTIGKCFGASRCLIGFGAASAVLALICLLVKNSTVQKACAALCAVAGLAMACAPGTILPLCKMLTMRCWTIMHPFALVCGIIIAALAIAQIVVLAKQR